ncbi:hypothetical protein fugu_011386 [Takifugu bimaculatus]|uniref:Uncharacterized protein n=1 Tax=Takifugu bimaculatus TaxID=433685 RepID=A0A4Z2C7G5_9TELE|nr:hypothetical protein fugu_011386 [Takifugu bimaculatus]
MGSALVGFGAAPDLRPVLHCAIGSCYRRGVLRAVGRFWGQNVSKLLMKFKKPQTTETAECFQPSWDPPPPQRGTLLSQRERPSSVMLQRLWDTLLRRLINQHVCSEHLTHTMKHT